MIVEQHGGSYTTMEVIHRYGDNDMKVATI